MKTVVKSDQVYHLWAHQSQARAFTSSRCTSFEGANAYSYSACIGRIVVNAAGDKAYLVGSRRYSVTTSAHQALLRRAIPYGEKVFSVCDVHGSPEDGLKSLVDDLLEAAQKASRARQNKTYLLDAVNKLVGSIQQYAAFFGLPVPELTQDNTDTIITQAAAIKEQAETAEKARQEQFAIAAEERSKERLAEWLAGKSVYGLGGLRTAYLRIAGSGSQVSLDCNPLVETTQGVYVPLADVLAVKDRLVRLSRICADGKASADTNSIGGSFKLGGYAVSGILSDGTVVVGCHRFTLAELERFYLVLDEYQRSAPGPEFLETRAAEQALRQPNVQRELVACL